MQLSFTPANGGNPIDIKGMRRTQLLEHAKSAHGELLTRIVQQEVYEGEGNAAPSMYEELALMERDIKKLKRRVKRSKRR